MTLNEILRHLGGVKGGNGQYTAKCPAHVDNKASLSVSIGKDGKVLLHCHAGCETRDIVEAMGLTMQDLFAEDKPGDMFPSYGRKSGSAPVVATYDYKNASGQLIAQKLRKADKSFSWRRPDKEKEWIYDRNGVPFVLYVPGGTIADTMFICEGEKDADNLHALGYDTACSMDGAGHGKWKKEYTEQLRGRHVVILPDNDKVGREYGEETANALHGVAASVLLLDLSKAWPEIPEHGDVSDLIEHFGADQTRQLIAELIVATTPWTPTERESGVRLTTIAAEALQGADIPPAVFIVKELLTAGLAALSAPPKYGKSWFVLQLCLAVASGMPFLSYDTEKSGCLYLALEDTHRRLQNRMNKLLNGAKAPKCFDFATSAHDLENGLLDELDTYAREHPAVKLIVIDTLQKVRAAAHPGEPAYAADYRTMTPLKELADRYGLCILVVHHLRKMNDDGDPFNRMSGTNGILGALDTAIVLTREKRTDIDTNFSVTGRDIDAQEKVITFDKSTCRWSMKGDADDLAEQRARAEYDESPIVVTIKRLLEQSPDGRWSGTAQELLDAGKYIAHAYLAPTTHKLGHELKAMDKPLFDYDKIIHVMPGNGTGGKKHHFYYQTIQFEELQQQEELPFT